MGCILLEFSGFKCREKVIYSLSSCATHCPLESTQNYSEKTEINESVLNLTIVCVTPIQVFAAFEQCYKNLNKVALLVLD